MVQAAAMRLAAFEPHQCTAFLRTAQTTPFQMIQTKLLLSGGLNPRE
jgi:hypothetical protein